MEARRQQVLDAAFACFARQGFHQTTVDDICRESELSPGVVYKYFRSKEEIIEAVCEGCQQANTPLIDPATGGVQHS
jgi:AcrR family transcriptional regulator